MLDKDFGPVPGNNSTMNTLFSAPQKMQWAVLMSKKIKRLQQQIAVPTAAAVGMDNPQPADSVSTQQTRIEFRAFL
jgi:hypothetical protein